ncbi:MAG: IclR family transcriptional regulator [Terrimicrobiaceae bacterium]
MQENNTIPILEKTVAIINALANSTAGISAKGLSLGLNVPPATCYRILRTLGKHNWIRSNDEGHYQIAFGLAPVASAYSDIEHLLRQLEVPLRALSDATGLSVKIAIREGESAVTAVRMESRRSNAISSKVGSKMHLAEAGAAGAILLSGLPKAQVDAVLDSAPKACWEKCSLEDFRDEVNQARRQKISRALGRFHPAIYAISIPLVLPPGNTAALAVIGWPDDFEGKKCAAMEKQLKEHGKHIKALIAHYSALEKEGLPC